jgi:hypothetical protein
LTLSNAVCALIRLASLTALLLAALPSAAHAASAEAASAAAVGQAQIPWIWNPDVLVPESSDRPIFLFFYSPSDFASRRMLTWTFTDPLVAQTLRRVVPVATDMALTPNLASHFAVARPPTVLLITPSQEVLARRQGVVNANDLVAMLNDALSRIEPAPQTEEPAPAAPSNPRLTLNPPQNPALPPSAPPRLGEGPGAAEPQHRPVASGQVGQDIPIQVLITGGADRVTLLHRRPGESAFHVVSMVPNTTELYYAVIPGRAVTLQGVEYYIEVVRGDLCVTLPPEGPGRPFRIGIH